MLFRSIVSPVLAAITLTAMIPSLSFAGAGSGGGGDFRCAEYSDLANRIAATLVELGQEKVRAVSGTVQIDDIVKVSKNLVCLPVSSLDRQARSYPANGHTDLLVSAWEELSRSEKVRLTAHEMSVLAGYERDGQYGVSDQILEMIQKSSRPLIGANRFDSASPLNSVVAKANEISLIWDKSSFMPRYILAVDGKSVGQFKAEGILAPNPAYRQFLNRIALNAKEGQLIRIKTDKFAPGKVIALSPQEFADLFQIENDL